MVGNDLVVAITSFIIDRIVNAVMMSCDATPLLVTDVATVEVTHVNVGVVGAWGHGISTINSGVAGHVELHGAAGNGHSTQSSIIRRGEDQT